MWSDAVISKLASMIGKPLFTEIMTTKRERLTYTRVCVEIDLWSVLPEYISVYDHEGSLIRQRVEYEWAPTRCTKCKTFGHKDESCEI